MSSSAPAASKRSTESGTMHDGSRKQTPIRLKATLRMSGSDLHSTIS